MSRGFVAAAAIASVTTFALVSHAAMSVLGTPALVMSASAKSTIGGPAVSFDGKIASLQVSEEGGKLVLKSRVDKADMGMRQNHYKKYFKTDAKPDAGKPDPREAKLE